MRQNKLKAQINYKRRYIKGGEMTDVADNILNRNYNPDKYYVEMKTIVIPITSQLDPKIIQYEYYKPIAKDSNDNRNRHTQIEINTLLKQQG